MLKIVGVAVATALGAALGLVGAFWAPLYFPGTTVRAPVSLVLALLGNPVLAWYALKVTGGNRAAAIPPALAWCVVWFLAAARTTEGDLLITDTNWVGLVTLFTGPIAFAVGVILMIRHRPRARIDEPPPQP